MRLQSHLAVHRLAEVHWHLAQIGVSAEARGAGVGPALLAGRLAVIDSTGLPAYLESSNERNRALYRRMGFANITTISGLPNTARDVAPPVTAPAGTTSRCRWYR